uniref:ZP domain-containing protein n=1 Tax=Steinernema glaseri TaxID=37863 RepID=A0A1I8A5K7_9BILA
MPYSLDISLVETQRYDYLIQQCLYNGQSRFIDSYGCFAGDRTFIKKWETTQYNIPGAVKRTIIHFIPQEPVLYIECRVKIIECCGCAEQSCERRPLLAGLPDFKETLVISVGGDAPVAGSGMIEANRNAGALARSSGGGIPWWVWLILGLILLFLLLLCCCLVAFCVCRRRKGQRRSTCAQKTPLPIAPMVPVPVKPTSEAPTVECDELSASASRAESALIATVQNPLDYRLDRGSARLSDDRAFRREIEQHLHTHNRFPAADGRSFLGPQIQSHLTQHQRAYRGTEPIDETLRGETERVMRQSSVIM